MNKLAQYAHGFARMIRLESKPLPAPEPLERKSLPMTGLFAHLPEDKKKFVLNYKGQSNIGGKEYQLGKAHGRANA